jgi:hypothetical protein
MLKRYSITTPTCAVRMEGGVNTAITLPNDSVVSVPLPLDDLQGLIEVTVNGETVLMFAEDIRRRGQPVSGAFE